MEKADNRVGNLRPESRTVGVGKRQALSEIGITSQRASDYERMAKQINLLAATELDSINLYRTAAEV